MKREPEEEEEDGEPETLTLAPPTPAAPPGIPIPPSQPPPPRTTTGMPIREDCWSEEASCTLVSAWGERYLELNRGNLRQKHWQSVADTVNNRHAAANSNNHPNNNNFKSRRTDVQCKNRIDTLKKKYKLEKARVMSSSYTSNWALYDQLDALIGTSVQTKKMMAVSSSSSPQRLALPYYQQQQPRVQTNSSVVVPLTLRGGDRQKRSAASSSGGGGGIHTEIDESFFRRNYSAVATDDVGGILIRLGRVGRVTAGKGMGLENWRKRFRSLRIFSREWKRRDRGRCWNWRRRGWSLSRVWSIRECSFLWTLKFRLRRLSERNMMPLLLLIRHMAGSIVKVVRSSLPHWKERK